jgi:heme exporter protein A
LFENVGFALGPGQMLLLKGRNGSGKTSLLRALLGLLEPEAGTIQWDGEPIADVRQAYCRSLVWMAHRVGLKADLTLVENLLFESSLRPFDYADFDAVLERLGLNRLKKLPVRFLSAGQQRRVGLARMLLADAPLWLMDEPFTNLDADGRQLVEDVLDEHLAAGGLCVIATHQDVVVDAPTQKVDL